MNIIDALQRWFVRNNRTLAPAILRVGLGVSLLSFYVLHYRVRGFIWGPSAFFSYEMFIDLASEARLWSVYVYADEALPFEVLFHGGLLITACWTLGLWTRITGILTYVMAFSLWSRNHFILDGGDNILIIALFFLMFARTDAHWALARLRLPRWVRIGDRELWYKVGTIVHNTAIVAIVAQVCVLYFTSALNKVQGQMWQEGVALYYVLRVQEFTAPGLAEHIYRNAVLVSVLTYATVFEQLAYPFMLLNRYAKAISVAIVVQMHVGIGVMMGLVSFSVVMILLQVAAFSDGELGRFWRVPAQAVGRVRAAIEGLVGRRRKVRGDGRPGLASRA